MERHTLLLSLLHLLVDGICACGVMLMSHQIVSDFEAGAMIVLYDVLAFGTQPLTGSWVDKIGASPRGLKLAMIHLACGALISLLHTSQPLFLAVPGAILLGMGNSLFHVYGGRYVAVASRNDICHMGVFVSTGTVGLTIGLDFSCPMLLAVFLLTFLTLSSLHICLGYRGVTTTCMRFLPIHKVSKPTSVTSQATIPVIYLSCLMLVVAGRACIGESVPSLRTSVPSISPPLMMVIVSIVVMIGKAAGGFLSKCWCVRNVFCISMLLSAAVFLLCPLHSTFVLPTLFLINLSMPCTLYLATKAVPGREGWAFGLLAMALLPGFLIGILIKDNVICQALITPLMATILIESLLLFYLHEKRWQVLAVSVLLNIFTNLPFNAFVMAYEVTAPHFFVGLECLVVIVELFGYWLVLHDWRKAFKYSFLCNSFSALSGYLWQHFLF